jgi:hypothetical protein
MPTKTLNILLKGIPPPYSRFRIKIKGACTPQNKRSIPKDAPFLTVNGYFTLSRALIREEE